MESNRQQKVSYTDVGVIDRKCPHLTTYKVIPYDCSVWIPSHTFERRKL